MNVVQYYVKGLWHGCLELILFIVGLEQHQLSNLIHHETWGIIWEWQNYSFLSKKILSSNHCCISVITNKKNECWKTGRLASFKKTVIAIYFSLPQVCPSLLPFVMLCHLYPLPTFWAVTVMFHSIWWQLHVYWFLVNILWHSFFYGNGFFCKIPWLFLDLNKKFVFPWDICIYFGLQWWPCSLIIIYLVNIIIFFFWC